MRLLNTQTWLMREFLSDNDVPAYAILSHTWEEDEIGLQQWESDDELVSHMKGFCKIKKFGEQAARDGYEWVWADTCCIDKKSSAELSEAINSMFRWYQNAALCYVYLSDAMWSLDNNIMSTRLRSSRWFTRGWTLQELIGPKNIEFYSADWRKIAMKTEICPLLSSITGIDEGILIGTIALQDVSIARRMSWASRRKTTRVEDTAYCLLGIFDINLPLIYGEGPKAFRRLQEAIMISTHDQSLFAWGRLVDSPSDLIDKDQELGRKPVPWRPVEERVKLLGLFAASPEDFTECGDITPLDHWYAYDINRRRPPTVVNGGALIDFVLRNYIKTVWYWDSPQVSHPHIAELMVLLCHIGTKESSLVGLVLKSWGDDHYSRTSELVRVHVESLLTRIQYQQLARTVHVMPHRPFQLKNGDILLRRWTHELEQVAIYYERTEQGPKWQRKWKDKVLRPLEDAIERDEIVFFYETQEDAGVAITFQRTSSTTEYLGSLVIGASLYKMEPGHVNRVRVPPHAEEFRQPFYSHTMQVPKDIWDFEVDGLARVEAKVERMALNNGGEVDVLDFGIYELGGDETGAEAGKEEEDENGSSNENGKAEENSNEIGVESGIASRTRSAKKRRTKEEKVNGGGATTRKGTRPRKRKAT